MRLQLVSKTNGWGHVKLIEQAQDQNQLWV